MMEILQMEIDVAIYAKLKHIVEMVTKIQVKNVMIEIQVMVMDVIVYVSKNVRKKVTILFSHLGLVLVKNVNQKNDAQR